MIDMHSHILPGLDDGAKDLAESLQMAAAAAASGVSIMVATPHGLSSPFNVTYAQRDRALHELRQELLQRQIVLELLPGMECWADEKALSEALANPECFMNYRPEAPERRCLLVECPPMFEMAMVDSLLFQAQLKGVELILAHPERHPDFRRQEKLLATMMDKGLVLQFNAEDIRRRRWFGGRERVIRRLIGQNTTQVVLGSDTHSQDRRPPNMASAREPICEWFDADIWEQLSVRNPSRLLGL
jgi:protein-tyrosine phosphatase